MLVFTLFIGMLITIALGVWAQTTILANFIGLIGISGLLVLYFHNPENTDGQINQRLNQLTAEQKKQWYGFFAISLFFSLLFGSFWNASMGGL